MGESITDAVKTAEALWVVLSLELSTSEVDFIFICQVIVGCGGNEGEMVTLASADRVEEEFLLVRRGVISNRIVDNQ